MPAPSRTRVALIAAFIFGLNAALCWPLFRVEYLNDLQSNEGSFISIARFLIEHWPHIAWFPWFNGGTPLENAYFPLVPALVAATSALARCSPAHAFHFLAALTYCLGPMFLFLFARKVSGLEAPSVVAALAWTLFSPALLVPQIRGDSNVFGTLHRLYLIVHNGETPHDLALSLLPLAWLLLARYWEAPTLRRFAFAAIVIAAIMASNAFGMAVITISTFLLWLALRWPANVGRPKHLVSTCAILLTAYLLICRLLPPSLLRQAAIGSQTLENDARHGWWVLALLPAVALLWWAAAVLRSHPAIQYVVFGVLRRRGSAPVDHWNCHIARRSPLCSGSGNRDLPLGVFRALSSVAQNAGKVVCQRRNSDSRDSLAGIRGVQGLSLRAPPHSSPRHHAIRRLSGVGLDSRAPAGSKGDGVR